ncbi:MAG TPA: hypothetical protein VIM75_03000 [Ohtaekwangia sp.]
MLHISKLDIFEPMETTRAKHLQKNTTRMAILFQWSEKKAIISVLR